jgi:hypothetical protein
MSLAVLRILRQPRVNALATQCIRQIAMQPMTADERPNILSDIKRDHANFFSLHRRFKEEVGISDQEKQVVIWQASQAGPCPHILPSQTHKQPQICIHHKIG